VRYDDERDGLGVGADALARGAASGVGHVEQDRGGQLVMRIIRSASLLVAFYLLGSAVAVTAQQTPEASVPVIRSLLAARSLKCSFNANAVADWKSGKPNVTRGHEDFGLHFDSIDVTAQKARLIGNQIAGDVTLFATEAGLHFMEQTPIGNIIITTVFASRSSDGFIAVSSRHMSFPGRPLPSQYHGICKLWD
jgi:hypothetical protein